MFSEQFKLLNKRQQQVVNLLDKNALITAPAGTGKTKVIALRTANLLRQGIKEEQILCMTFTNKAAKEMQERILSYTNNEAKNITIKTFHSFCYYLITQEKKASHYTFPCTIIDEADSEEIIDKMLQTLDYKKEVPIKLITDFIEQIKRYSLSLPQDLRYQYDQIIPLYIKENKIQDDFLRGYGVNIVMKYQRYLRNNNSLDFMDLVVEAKYLLDQQEIATKWNAQYRYIQVDEMQDTSSREYDILTILAKGNNIILFGDFNQTIYEWRGSDPLAMVNQFREQFEPTELQLTYNYRSTQMLLGASDSYIRESKLDPIQTKAYSKHQGERIKVYKAKTPEEEYGYIAKSIASKGPEHYSKVAILTRTNGLAKSVSKVLQGYDIPCIQVDDVKIFRKKEVKDILAIFKMAIDARNSAALLRVLKHPTIKIEDWLLEGIRPAQKYYMHLHDWFKPIQGDAYRPLLEAFHKNEIVVLDVESTGLDTTQDDIIQIAAIQYGKDGVNDTLDVLVKPTRPVGASYHVHGFSDEELQQKGLMPEDALNRLLAFVQDKVIVGHNINYDVQIIKSMLSRYQLATLEVSATYDTLDLANKLYPLLPNHKLETLAKLIGTEATPNHNALQDILATSEVLTDFIYKIDAKKAERYQCIEQYAHDLVAYKERIFTLKDVISTRKTYEAIAYLMKECGLKAHYTSQQQHYLRELYSIAKSTYDQQLSQEDNIIKLLATASLHYSDLEKTSLFKDKVAIMTVHQAKGLEFEEVYIAGCNEGIFPLYYSVKSGRISEEKRLFYVAMTRPKKKLYITYNLSKKKSMLIDEIGKDFKEYVNKGAKEA